MSTTRSRVTYLLVGFGLAMRAAAQAEERFVPCGYETPCYATIREAIEACDDGDVVIVRDSPTAYTGLGFRDIDFLGKRITVRSQGDHPGDCAINCEGAPGLGNEHRAFHFHNGETIDSVVRGFTITGGYTTAYSPGGASGGAVLCERSSPQIINCVFDDNESAGGSGGAVACLSGSSPMISNCTFTANKALDQLTGWGGAISCNDWSSPLITDCTIRNNRAYLSGGAIECRLSRPIIMGCAITGNQTLTSTQSNGDAIRCRAASPIIVNCLIVHNDHHLPSGPPYGGGIGCTNL